MSKMVKHTIHLYELPDYMEDEFMVSTYKSDEYSFPYIGSVEVEFEMPEIVSKDVRLAELDKALEQQKAQYEEAVKRIEEAKEKLKKGE